MHSRGTVASSLLASALRRMRGVALACTLLSTPACTLDAHDLDAFRTTASGPDKLKALVEDPARAPDLRAEAALRLLDLARRDVDGRALLLQALGKLDAHALAALAPTFTRGLSVRMQTPEGAAPSEAAARAKDTGVKLLSMLEGEPRAALGELLLRWMGADPDRRGACGELSLEEVAARVGPDSGRVSAESLRPALTPAALTRLTETVHQHADSETRALAASKVVAVEHAYRTQPERETALVTHVLPALGRLADTEPARTRLIAIAADTAKSPVERRLALERLEGHVTRAELSTLATIAADGQTPLELRELSLARLRELRDPEVLPTLIFLSGERTLRSLRQPAAELAIELGGERALASVLRSLPHHWNVTYAKSELDAYAERVLRLPVTPQLTALLGAKLYSIFWWSRVIAIRYFAQRADPVDATWRLRLHVEDRQEILGEGWPAKHTVGREANAALRAVTSRS